jgi:multiple antibiotic resistance protein
MLDPAVLETFRTVTFAFAALFPVVNPIGCAPIFLSLTRHYPQSVQQLLARKIALYGFLILVSSLLLGTWILEFFGITIHTVQMAGGLVLASAGWKMLNQGNDASAQQQHQADTLEVAMENAFYPLTLPLTVGPGCISIAITLGAHIKRESAASPEHVPLTGAAITGMGLVCVLVWVCYANAGRLVKMLGDTATIVLTRLSSFILLAIGFQIFWNGFTVAIVPVLQIFAR